MTRKSNHEELFNKLFALIEANGNVAESCRQFGINRSVYYRFRKNETRDVLSSETLSSDRKTKHVSAHIEKRLLELCLKYPEWGCDRLAHYLTLTGDRVSSPTAQKILIRHGLGKIKERQAAIHIGSVSIMSEDV